jgi:hypothetical protein
MGGIGPKKHIRLNQRLFCWILKHHYAGSISAMASQVAQAEPELDEQSVRKTIGRWIDDERPEPKWDTVSQYAHGLPLPGVAFSLGYSDKTALTSDQLLGWLKGLLSNQTLNRFASQLDAMVKHVHWANVLPDDDGKRWFRAQWTRNYVAPEPPIYALISVKYEGDCLDAVFSFGKRFFALDVLDGFEFIFDYGELLSTQGKTRAYEVFTERAIEKRIGQGDGQITVATWLDRWADWFIIRSNTPCQLEIQEYLDATETDRRLSDPQDPLVGFRRAIVHSRPIGG